MFGDMLYILTVPNRAASAENSRIDVTTIEYALLLGLIIFIVKSIPAQNEHNKKINVIASKIETPLYSRSQKLLKPMQLVAEIAS